jgi:hypothetical protein
MVAEDPPTRRRCMDMAAHTRPVVTSASALSAVSMITAW